MDGHVAVMVAVSGHPRRYDDAVTPQFPQPLPARLAEHRNGAGGQERSRNYLVKYQYSGSRVNIALYTTSCSLVLAAMISYGFGTGTQRYGSCCAA
jgi:hypothetical protein